MCRGALFLQDLNDLCIYAIVEVFFFIYTVEENFNVGCDKSRKNYVLYTDNL